MLLSSWVGCLSRWSFLCLNDEVVYPDLRPVDGAVVALVGDVVLVSRPCWLHVTREGGLAVPVYLALRQFQSRSVLCTRSDYPRHSPKRLTAVVEQTPRRWLASPTFREYLVEASYSEHALFTTARFLHCNLTGYLAFSGASTIISLSGGQSCLCDMSTYTSTGRGFLLSPSPTI